MTAPELDLVDIVDEDGNTSGVAPRREMRQKRRPHRCVYLLVFNARGDLFIHLRTPTKDVYPDHWDVAVGGVLEAGENFDEGVRRECREELGVLVKPHLLFPFRYSDSQTIVHAHVFQAVHDGPFVLQAEEVVRGEFVPIGELSNRMQQESFCPDGMAVWTEFLRHNSNNNSGFCYRI